MGTASSTDSPVTLRELKVRASLLLKDLASPDPARTARAAERLRQLPAFAGLSLGELLARKGSVQRKHALAAIAREQGHASWSALKQALETPSTRGVDTGRFFEGHQSGQLNRWFAAYEQADSSRRSHGGFLFPFRHQFFVCEAGFLKALGMDPADPDWERLGYDWARPRDAAAHARLEAKLIALGYGGRDAGR